MSEMPPLQERKEQVIQQMVALGIPENQARAMLDRALAQPPTNEEIVEAFRETIALQRNRIQQARAFLDAVRREKPNEP